VFALDVTLEIDMMLLGMKQRAVAPSNHSRAPLTNDASMRRLALRFNAETASSRGLALREVTS
jgi:hypothetical protein